MHRSTTTLLALLLLAGSAAAADLHEHVELPLKTPRSRDPVLGGTREKVFVSVWIPDGVKVVRGAICNPFAKNEPPSAHWQAACRHWQFAYVQTDFDAVKKDEFPLLTTALTALTKATGHPELQQVPFCFLGMSRGGGMSVQLAELLPERTLASAPVCLEVGPESEAARRIPMLTVFGEKDGQQMPLLLGKLPKARQQDARWAIAVQWNRKHEFGQANNLAIPFFDDVIAQRLPSAPAREGAIPLSTIPLENGWLGDVAAWNKNGQRPPIHAWKDYPGDRAQACWFPSQRVAAVWAAFVAASKEVAIAEPAGLGDGQKFVTHSAAQPLTVKLTLTGKLPPKTVTLWDGATQLATRDAPPWNFTTTLKPGIHSLYATLQDDMGERCSRPHTIFVSE